MAGALLSPTRVTADPTSHPTSDVAPGPGAALGVDERLVDAALRCIARWGVTKTSLDDVAREARCSRATVYRAFPGGREALFATVVRVEVARFVERLAVQVGAAGTVEDALVAAIAEAGRTLTHHGALQYLLQHEPGIVMPYLAFRRLDDLLATAAEVGGPLLTRFIDQPHAARVAEWVTRITLSYTLSPVPAISTADVESVRTLVRTFVLPGIDNL